MPVNRAEERLRLDLAHAVAAEALARRLGEEAAQQRAHVVGRLGVGREAEARAGVLLREALLVGAGEGRRAGTAISSVLSVTQWH